MPSWVEIFKVIGSVFVGFILSTAYAIWKEIKDGKSKKRLIYEEAVSTAAKNRQIAQDIVLILEEASRRIATNYHSYNWSDLQNEIRLSLKEKYRPKLKSAEELYQNFYTKGYPSSMNGAREMLKSSKHELNDNEIEYRRIVSLLSGSEAETGLTLMVRRF